MAGDILLYQTDLVPIGDDQRQHLELARNIATRFNQRFGDLFRVPEAQYPGEGARIMDLTEPTKKMSTSTSPEMGKILMKDPPDLIRRKVMSAVTDTGREVRRGADKPGITNLIDLMSVATGRSAEQIEKQYDGQGYGTFKKDVAEAVVACLDPIRGRFENLMADPGELERMLRTGAEQAAAAAAPTLEAMYERMGFVRP